LANHKSALKRNRQSEKRRALNRINKTKAGNAVKKVRLALLEYIGLPPEAKTASSEQSGPDAAAQEGAAKARTGDDVLKEAEDLLRGAMRTLFKGASKGSLHKRTAARRISRLSKYMRGVVSASESRQEG
jgi:small subunit ribosomal protein S20